jgi:ATP-dependent RNA helicase DHX37/DHR1
MPTTYTSALPQKPNEKTIALIKQILAAGFCDQIAIRADLLPSPPAEERKAKRAIEVKYKTLFSSSGGGGGDDSKEEDPYVYIHPSSLLARLPPSSTPRYIIYQRLQRSQPSRPGAKARVRMHALTSISAAQIASITRNTGLLEVGKPIGKILVLPVGPTGEERRECDVMLSLSGDDAGLCWPLIRKRVVQMRVPKEGWVVEKWID